MPKKTEELEAIFIRERQRWGETTITTCVKSEDSDEYAKAEKRGDFDIDKYEQTVKLDCDPEELEPGITYRFYGSWFKHWKYGDQFHAKTHTKITPHDKHGIINYLMKTPGIGKKRAEKAWKLYGGDAVKKLREAPRVAGHAIGFTSPEQAEDAAAFLEEQKDLENATISVFSLLAGRGFPKKLPKEVIKAMGNQAAEKIRKNPYLLLKYKGVGFARADEMYLDLGHNPAALKRQALAIAYGIASNSDGHTWFGTHFVEATLREAISGAAARPVKAIKLAMRAGLIAIHRDDQGQPWFTARAMDEAERDIATMIEWLSSRSSAWPELGETDLSPHQIEQLAVCTEKPVGIFAGNPGTGKSFTAARIVARIAELNGYDDIAVVAPTGKAAVRVTEAMNECGVEIRAKTVHSLLQVSGVDGSAWSFERNRENPIEQRYVILDEASMMDTPIMASLLRAMRTDGHLLLVGDLQQLPPVGHGAPLRDLLAADVPFGNLTEIRRNQGAIVATCAAIRDQQPVRLEPKISPPERNLAIMRTTDAEIAERVEALVKAIRDRELADPTWDTQVIVALNEKSTVSRRVLNKALQAELNKKNREKGSLWINDKIVCLRNQLLPVELEMMESVDDDLEGMTGETASGDAACYIANGEIGRVIAVYPNKVVMEFYSPRRIVFYPKQPKQEVEGFDLGYAISCHKSQGSQWPVVIVALDPSGGARRVCDRSWIYTAISRAKDVCFLVGRDQTLTTMCASQKIDKRKTFLVERLREQRSRFTAEEKRDAV